MQRITIDLLDGTSWAISDELIRGRSSLELWEWMHGVGRAVSEAARMARIAPGNDGPVRTRVDLVRPAERD